MVNEERLARDLFVIGASAGGIEAAIAILERLPAELPATLAIALHRSPTPVSALDDVLGRRSRLPVSEPKHGDPILVSRVHLSPQDLHLLVDGERWALSPGPPVHRARPAIDPLFISAAASRGARVVGVLLSGGGVDGVEGLIEIKRRGGLSIAQEPAQARQPSMPRAAILYDHVDLVLRVEDMAAAIRALAEGRAVSDGDAIGARKQQER